jgi:hypothetical protein
MRLIEEIIGILSSENGKLTDALIKTKVLLHQIGHKDLAEWVNNELNGYPSKDAVPPYRVLGAQVLVNAASVVWRVNSHPIPLGHLTEKQREDLEQIKMTESLAVLEKFASKDKGALQAPIPMEFNGILGKGLAEGVHIQSAWCEIQITSIASILIQVRSRLLDFLLELRAELPGDIGEAEAKERGSSIDAAGLLGNAIFGDNTTILVGHGSTQIVSNKIAKGDFNALAEALRKQNVSDADIAGLQEAIAGDAESAEHQQKEPGPRVKTWMKSMLAKAVDAGWKIQVAAAGNLLATAIKMYYGWP